MKVTTFGLDSGKQIFQVQVTRGEIRSAIISLGNACVETPYSGYSSAYHHT